MSVYTENELKKMFNDKKNIDFQLNMNKQKFSTELLNGLGERIKQNVDKPIIKIKRKNKIEIFFERIWNLLHKMIY